MPSPNATPTPITPPRVPLIDPRTGLIDRAWYMFFLSLLDAATIVDDGDLGTNVDSLLASYDAALQALAQEVETQPPPVDLSAELIKQIEAAGLIDCCSGLVSQVAEMQKQLEALNLLPPPTQGTVTAVTATAPVVSSGGTAPDISMPAASTSVSGYLTSTDWNTFNNKAPATSGTSILYGNGTGGFSNVTIGTGVSFAAGTLSATGSGGTVTSVTGTSPVVSSGGTTPAISLASGYGDTQNPYAAKTANFVLAGPTTGAAAVPTFRAIVVGDIPTLNQNTTGSAATLTTGRTIAITGDLSYTSPSFNGSGNVTAAGTLATVNTNVGSFTNASITVNGKGLITAASSGTAPVTSVTGTSPVASSGGATPAISLSAGYGDTLNPYASKTANFFLAAPNGSAGVPTFRAVVAADIPTLNQNTTGSAATLTTGRTIAITGDLSYTSPSFNGSSNVTAAGTLATVNANVGSFTNATLTVNGKGLITAASSGTAPVTSVTGTAPVVSSGGTTPAISMAAANGSTNGYLTSTDWTTFNNKGSGTVTSVAALTLGTTGTDLSSTVANGTTTPVITLNVPTASAVNRGALSAADWTTFNNKQPAGSYVTLTGVETLQNKTLDDTNTVSLKDTLFTLEDNVDGTKLAQFQLSGITTGTTRTYTLPNLTGSLATIGTLTQTFSGTTTFSAATVTVGSSTAASTYGLGTGATISGSTKTVNIATNGVSGSTTTVTFGSTFGTTTTFNGQTKIGGSFGRGAPVTKTADFTLADTENWLINNKSGSTCVVTLPAASSWVGREVTIKNMQAQLVNSASSNIVPIDSTTAGTAILLAVVGNWATMVSDGTNWVIMQQAANNCLLLE